MSSPIQIRGARTHNLKNIDVDLPRDKLIVITGLSGSGKSSLAFDTIYAEGQRRYVESLSAYARQFLSLMEKPDVDLIEGLSPAISIEQKATSHNPRSTVGTVTEIYDYLRLLFARVGEPRCPEHGVTLEAQTVSQMVDQIMVLPESSKLLLLAPIARNRKGTFEQVFDQLRKQGFIRVRVDGKLYQLDEIEKLEKNIKHDIDAVVDRLIIKAGQEQRLAESIETTLALSDGTAIANILADDNYPNGEEILFSAIFSCPYCGYSLSELEPRLFSFNNPAGACTSCDGLGVQRYFDPERIIADSSKSLAEGAVPGWDKRHAYYHGLLSGLARHFNFDLSQPFESLSKEAQNAVLYGTGNTPIEYTYPGYKSKRNSKHRHPFEGVVNNFERRYRDTESNTIKEDMARYITSDKCTSCHGSRLRVEAQNVFIEDQSINQLTEMTVDECLEFFKSIRLQGKRAEIAEKIVNEIIDRLGFLSNVGLNYLSMDRSADTLSGGEAQRIRLASQIGSGLVGVMYVLDEPSIGLHQRDNGRLLKTLFRLRDLGNTIIVVEHDEEAIRNADYLLDLGPGAGQHGGDVVASGTPDKVLKNQNSITAQYLNGIQEIEVPSTRHCVDKKRLLKIKGAKGNNLKSVNLDIPVGLFTCVTGVSGSGKSTLINDTLYPAMARKINKSRLQPSPFLSIEGIELFDKIIEIDQSPIGRTPRSNPATYTGLFTHIRELFAQTQESRARGYAPGRFSFNVKGGRCEACQGDGLIKVEMHFLPDIFVPCDVCKGKRYNRETLDIRYKNSNISEVLNMTVEEAAKFFYAVPSIKRKLDTLLDVGLSYIQLGQSATTLSGGEAQRIKLAKELSKRDTGNTLYLLDEPTTGLHFHDIKQLLKVIHRLRDHGNTVITIEHNLDVIKTADWIIDLGPEGGNGGGEIIAQGPPEKIIKSKISHTGKYLKKVLSDSGQKQELKLTA